MRSYTAVDWEALLGTDVLSTCPEPSAVESGEFIDANPVGCTPCLFSFCHITIFTLIFQRNLNQSPNSYGRNFFWLNMQQAYAT